MLGIVILAEYSYIKFKSTTAHGNVDSLSRLPCRDATAVENLSDAANFNIA